MSNSVGRREGKGRVRIARALSGGAKTVSQVAAALDTVDGALRSAVTGMERDGQIRRVEPRVARGQRWELTDAGRAQLLERATGVEPGVILPGQRLLLLVDQGQGVTLDAWQTLAEHADLVLWAVRMDGNGPLLLAFDSAAEADELRARLGGAGMSSVAGRVSETLDPTALLRAAPRPRALPA
jgi:hypothetical protein